MTIQEMFNSVKRYGYVADAEWKESDHPRGDDGQFTDGNGRSDKKRKGALKEVSKTELHDFIQRHKTSKDNERISLGRISQSAKERILRMTGLEIERVILDSDSIRHAYSKSEHNLLPDDLDDMKEVIETTTDIELSPKRNATGNPVIIFKKQESNGIILCEEYRAGKKELELQTAYRKFRQPHGAHDELPANVRNATVLKNTIARNAPEVKSIAGLWQMIRQNKYL